MHLWQKTYKYNTPQTGQRPAEVLTGDNEEWSGISKPDSAALPMSQIACEVAKNALLQQA